MMMRQAVLGAALVAAMSGAHAAEPTLKLGENSAGREILVDPNTLVSLPAVPGVRNFAVKQISLMMRGPANKGAIERVRYNFNCAARTAAAVIYFRTLKGQRTHDWRGADIAMKYYPVERGGLVEMALNYACGGARVPLPGLRLAPVEEEDAGTEDDAG
ncbi:MAG: hypothetical protein ACKOXK_11990 [Chakrabartia sp.]